MKTRVLIALVVIAAAAAAGAWWLVSRPAAPAPLVLYGNIDLRQVDLPFNDNGRIEAVLVEEGDRVKQGQVLARLDTSRLVPAVAQAEARAVAQAATVEKLHNGSRPEEIAQARANLAQARADAENAALQFQRRLRLVSNGTISRQDYDNAKAALDMANARVELNRKALDLQLAGPRKEDIAAAEAELRADQAQLALARQELADAVLKAPTDATVRSRLMEPGEMAAPTRPVLSLAVTDPKWVRAYVSEPDLGRIRPGETAAVTVDSFPNRRFAGWVGFISPVAEFTPKTVETTQLRTSLVYEVRVFVKDPGDTLRLGMPATVSFPQNPAPPNPTTTPQAATP